MLNLYNSNVVFSMLALKKMMTEDNGKRFSHSFSAISRAKHRNVNDVGLCLRWNLGRFDSIWLTASNVKMYLPSKIVMFHCHVDFQGSISTFQMPEMSHLVANTIVSPLPRRCAAGARPCFSAARSLARRHVPRVRSTWGWCHESDKNHTSLSWWRESWSKGKWTDRRFINTYKYNRWRYVCFQKTCAT